MSKNAIKHDKGKAPLGLLPWDALLEVAQVMDFGAQKYNAHNWRGGFDWSRLQDAALRHLAAHINGEDKDPESGLSHVAHAACCVLFLLSHEINAYGVDDRYKPSTSSAFFNDPSTTQE